MCIQPPTHADHTPYFSHVLVYKVYEWKRIMTVRLGTEDKYIPSSQHLLCQVFHPNNPYTATSKQEPSSVLADWWDKGLPMSGHKWHSIVTPWQTSVSIANQWYLSLHCASQLEKTWFACRWEHALWLMVDHNCSEMVSCEAARPNHFYTNTDLCRTNP